MGKKAFLILYKEIYQQIKDGKLFTKSGDKFRLGTVRAYESCHNRLELYETETGIIYLEDINVDWADKFRHYLNTKNFAKNTISTTLSTIKSVLAKLQRKGITIYTGTGIITSKEITTAVYSSLDDIKALMALDLTDRVMSERTRDFYILQCFLGLRFSDMAKILKDAKPYIKTDNGLFFIEIKTIKTGEIVVIPMAEIVKEILQKYDYKVDVCVNLYNFNERIKKVAKKAGINQPTIFSQTKGGERKDTTFPKYVMMSSHTARRTFATLAFLMNMPERNIMMITGHRTKVAFDRYIRCSSMDAAIQISNHPFFSLPLPTMIGLANVQPNNILLQNDSTVLRDDQPD